MPWSAYDGSHLRFRQSKTGRRTTMPAGMPLRALLDSTERRSPLRIRFSPDVPSSEYVDMFGNTCTRIVAPAGLIEIRNEFVIDDSGLPDEVAPDARQLEVGGLSD